jgi:hypothetical protein
VTIDIAHLREILMSCGVLPAIDKQVCSFERWLAIHLDSIADDSHAQIIRRFTTWEVLPRLRARAEPRVPAATQMPRSCAPADRRPAKRARLAILASLLPKWRELSLYMASLSQSLKE